MLCENDALCICKFMYQPMSVHRAHAVDPFLWHLSIPCFENQVSCIVFLRKTEGSRPYEPQFLYDEYLFRWHSNI